MNKEKRLIAMTGSGGHLGRLVAEGLLRTLPASQLRVISRSVGKLQSFGDRGVECVAADFDAPLSMSTAFKDVGTLLIISADTPNEVRIRQHRAAIDAAAAAGVGRIVYTSAANPSPDSLFPFALSHRLTEEYLAASNIPYTIVRNGLYMENLDVFLSHAAQSGVLAHPGSNGKVAYISRRDIAMAIVNILGKDGHVGKTYELTGAEAISLVDIAKVTTSVLGRPISAIELPADIFRETLASFGLPPFMVEAIGGLYAAVGAGEYAKTSTDAEGLNGWKPTSFQAYLESRREVQ